MYLREMGTVPLLKREGEVAIAKRIERGRLLVLKTATRSPMIIKELIAIAHDLRQGNRSIKEIVQFDEDEKSEVSARCDQENMKQQTGWRRRLDSNSRLSFTRNLRFIGGKIDISSEPCSRGKRSIMPSDAWTFHP
jgi:hypothetical protein